MSVRLDIESLRALTAVVDAGGITRAAVRLNLTQPAVSHKLKRLEQRLGRVLLRRGEGGVRLTQDGEQLLRYAERLVSLHDEAVAMLAREQLSGSLRLGLNEDMTGAGIARILARFSTLYPEVTLASRVAHSWTLTAWMDRGELDLALVQVFAQQLKPTDHVLWWDDLVWVQSPDFAPARLQSLPFISFDPSCFYRAWAMHAVARHGAALRVVLDCPSVEGVSSAVLSGLGLSLINRRNLREGLVESSLDLPVPPRVVYVARLPDRAPSAPTVTLLAAIQEELSDR